MAPSWRGRLLAIDFGGRRATEVEVNLLQDRLPDLVTDWFLWVVATYDLIGTEVTLSPSEDPSGLGVDFKWMTPAQIVNEATEAQPGIAARRHRLLPVGLCMAGSGDPYFVAARLSDDPALLRVPHEAVHDTELDTRSIETVSDRLSDFLSRNQRRQ